MGCTHQTWNYSLCNLRLLLYLFFTNKIIWTRYGDVLTFFSSPDEGSDFGTSNHVVYSFACPPDLYRNKIISGSFSSGAEQHFMYVTLHSLLTLQSLHNPVLATFEEQRGKLHNVTWVTALSWLGLLTLHARLFCPSAVLLLLNVYR